MHEYPIIFSAPMVRAILEDRKTQTRRVTRPQPTITPEMDSAAGVAEFYDADERVGSIRCPYGSPGRRLWVRESFSGHHEWETIPPAGWGWDHSDVPIWYWADGNPEHGDWTRPRPSIHMPRWASRITLEITDMRVQRVQDISYEDAIAEGIPDPATMQEFPHGVGMDETVVEYCRRTGFPQREFRELWDSINAKKYPWASNPWVWAIAFKRVKG